MNALHYLASLLHYLSKEQQLHGNALKHQVNASARQKVSSGGLGILIDSLYRNHANA